MTSELFTLEGQRKYLDDAEHARFLAAAAALERGEVRTLCTTLAYTGCRISEALELTADRIDLSSQVITFRSLKKRGRTLYRSIPVPEAYLDTLELVHGVRKDQRGRGGGQGVSLWSWGPTQATKHVWAVMEVATIAGPQCRPRRRTSTTVNELGLIYSAGVRATTSIRAPGVEPLPRSLGRVGGASRRTRPSHRATSRCRSRRSLPG